MSKPPALALVRHVRTTDKPKPVDIKEKLFRATLRFGPIEERVIETSSIGHMHHQVQKCAMRFLRGIDGLHPGRLKKRSLKMLRHRITVQAPAGHLVKEYYILLLAKDLIAALSPESP